MRFIDAGATLVALEGLELKIRAAAYTALEGAVKDGVSSAKESKLFKDVTGATRASVSGSVDRSTARGIVVAGGAARWLESGTRPHRIEAKGKALAFSMNGEMMFRKVVDHPGTAARPFMQQARDQAERSLDYYAEMFINEAVK